MNSSASPIPARVLITGATGFIGKHLIEAAAPLGLRLAVRERAMSRLPGESIKVGAIDEATDWSGALRGIEAVVHLAARVHVMKPTPADAVAFERTNVAGTEALARAAAAAGVKRFVFLSSIKVNGEHTTDRAFTADDAPLPADGYARSKYEAERGLRAISEGSGLSVAIIRPPLVYGPGVGANFLRLLQAVDRGIPLPLASVGNVRSMVGVENLCDLICRILRVPQPARGVYLAADGEDLATRELISRLARMMRKPTRLIPVPLPVLRAVAGLAGKRAELERLTGSLQVDITATCSRLDWRPPLSVDECLERTVQWYLARSRAGEEGRA